MDVALNVGLGPGIVVSKRRGVAMVFVLVDRLVGLFVADTVPTACGAAGVVAGMSHGLPGVGSTSK